MVFVDGYFLPVSDLPPKLGVIDPVIDPGSLSKPFQK